MIKILSLVIRLLPKVMELSHLEGVPFYLAVNNLITVKMSSFFFSLIPESSGFIRYFLNKVDLIILINGKVFLDKCTEKYLGIIQYGGKRYRMH